MRWSPFAVIKRTTPDWLTQWEYAHRGLHGNGVPENSLQGARLAIGAGMGIECDIQRSLDDWPMVFHDWDLKRMTGEDAETGQRSKAELQALHYLGSEERIATLPDLLDVIGGQVPLLVEIKSKAGYDVARSCQIVAEALASYPGLHAVMSFDPRVAGWFRKHSPQTCAGLVVREDERGHTQKAWQRRMAYWIARPDFLAYHIAALPSAWVAKLRKKGLPILTWTVNSPETRERALVHAGALIAEGEGLA